MAQHAFDVVIIGTGAGGGTMAHALADTGARILLVERGEPRPARSRELGSGRGLEAAALPHDGALARRQSGDEFLPYTHYCVGGNTKFWGSVLVPAAPRGLRRAARTSTASRRPGRSTTTRWRRTTTRAERLYHVHGEARRRPHRAAARPVSASRRSPHAPVMQAIVERLRGAGPASVAAAARRAGPGRAPTAACSATPATRSRAGCDAKSDAEVCCVVPALARAQRDAVDRHARRAG